jgi:D-glycero-D-manno-heptose 1,7-bisphosphate phosphatase
MVRRSTGLGIGLFYRVILSYIRYAPTSPEEENVEMGRRGVFLDLNGTLVTPLKPERLDEITLIPGVVEAVARLSAAGFVCPVVTVQSRIAKGLFSLPEFEIWFASFAAGLRAHGALVAGPYVCPHRFAYPCPCKKPNTLLYDRAVTEHQLKPADCFVIGDSPEDVGAARRLGARGCLVRTGWATDPRVVEKAAPDASVVVSSLAEAADWILHF